MIFDDRHHAGKLLAEKLSSYLTQHPIIIALPRGGVPIGYEIAKSLQSPFVPYIVRKIGVPWQRELGVGAITEHGIELYDEALMTKLNIRKDDLREIIQQEQQEIQRRLTVYRQNQPIPDLNNTTIIIVDDGIATGITTRAAIEGLRIHHPKDIIVASPVCSLQTTQTILPIVTQLICLETPENLEAVGKWYKEFHQLTDEDVMTLLTRDK